MKVLAHLFVALSGTCLSAQDYIPVLQNENQWEIFDYDYEFNPDCGWHFGSSYFLDGDSLIGDQQYVKLRSNRFNQSGSPFFCPPFTLSDVQNEWVFLLREDSLSQQVFIWNGFEEVLLYDFSLQVGDEITVGDVNSVYNSEVTLVDTITTDDGIERRRLQLGNASTPPNFEWIEGIGSIYGLVTQFGIGFGTGRTLLCFRHDDQGVFGEDCGLLLGLGDHNYIDNDIVTISPNPSNSYVQITWPSHIEIKSLKAYDAQGRIVFSEQNHNSHNQAGISNKLSIDLSSPSPGIYFIQFETNDGFIVNRWIKK